MNPRGNERHLCNLQIMKLASHEKLLRWHITIWCTSLFQCDKPWRILDAKAAVDKEWTKLKTIPAWQLDRAKSKKEVIDEARRDKNNVHFATLNGRMSPWKMRSFNPNYRSTKAESCFGWHCKIRPWSLRIFFWNRARLRPRWLLQKKWTLAHDYQLVMDKQLVQYPHTLR